MRAPISVIIATRNAEDSLPDCLNALMEGVEAGLIRELIVSDAGSTDATGAVAQAWGAEVLQDAPPRGAQLHRACAQARGDWLLILHPDTVLAPGWTRAVSRHLAHPDKAGWFRYLPDRKGLARTIAAGWAQMRSRRGVPYGEQGLLISASVYTRTDGYREVPEFEDIAMARALRGRLIGLDASVQVKARTFHKRGRKLWIVLRCLAGADIGADASRDRR